MDLTIAGVYISVMPSPKLKNSLNSKPIRIAISGGGIAGATLMNALLQNPNIDPHIYESAPEFSERGAAVGLSINAQRALTEIGPNMRDALDRAGAVKLNSTRLILVGLLHQKLLASMSVLLS